MTDCGALRAKTDLEPQVILSGHVIMSVERVHCEQVHQQRVGSATAAGLVGHPPGWLMGMSGIEKPL